MAAPEDARYRQSSQYRLWSFSPAQLTSIRDKTNSLARASISERLLANAAAAGGASSSSSTSLAPASATAAAPSSTSASAQTSSANTPDPTEQPQPQPQQQQQQQQQPRAAANGGGLPEFLTPAEERQLLTYFTIELLRAGTFCKVPTDMKATAAVFLRRFYLTNSIMTYPPTDILKTCLFFGCKAEGWYQSATVFADKFPNTTAEEILAGEFLLCQGLRFAFDVKHPFRALEGAIMELRRYGDVEEKRIVAAHGRARDILKFSPLVTDAYFHYTPSQIMLAALSLADRGLADRIVAETFGPAPSQTTTNNNKPSTAAAADGESSASTPNGGGSEVGNDTKSTKESRKDDKAKTSSAEVRDKLLAAVEACRDMLSEELPERMTEYWGTPASNKLIKPLRQKLKRCHDPDRWDLVALQKVQRGLVAKNGTAPQQQQQQQLGSALEADAAVFGDPAGHDAKRRRVGEKKLEDDPFGGPL
ncbi:hypothetical protein VTK73DRAFT_662 [Phialemonium thermophilum]|uniref:Cyclin C-terminal domain-containing protein n=1 Tax=Phialemonium thermophilum TaxID=223376 RepID=A0ABR3VUJ8_9PEZI